MSNVELIRKVYEAFARGDVPAVVGAMDSNIEWRQAENNPYRPDGSPWFGPDAILQELFMKLAGDWGGTFAVTPKKFTDGGDTVVTEGRYTGTWAATGKKIDAQFCHVFRVRDGKIIHFQQYTDTAQLQDAMGAR